MLDVNEKMIRDEVDKASDARNDGGKFNGMSYEDGVIAALEWVLGEANETPMED